MDTISAVEVKKDGDSFLSGFDRQLWNLTYHILLKFEVPVIFKVYGPDAPKRLDQHIEFFIPVNCACTYEIGSFIFEELKHMLRSDAEDSLGTYFWGTHLSIYTYSGTNTYLERPVVERLAQHGLDYLNRKIEEMLQSQNNRVIN